MSGDHGGSPFVFPPWANLLRWAILVGGAGGLLYAVVIVWLGFSPETTDVGYEPEQPVPYSHALHVGQLGVDCRYCHTTVAVAGHAAIPPTQTCMNCHQNVRAESDKLIPIRESFATGLPVEWIRVHDLPDYAYFDHSAHVSRGVGCVSCHGRADTMEVVHQVETLSMGWCLDCHRDPEPHLVPLDRVTDLGWAPSEDRAELGRRRREERNLNPPTDCYACHR